MNSVERWIKISFLSATGMGQRKFQKVEKYLEVHKLSWLEFWDKVDTQKLNLEADSNNGLTANQLASIREFKDNFTISGFQEYLEQSQIKVILKTDGAYPWLLSQIDDPPAILFVKTRNWQSFLELRLNSQDEQISTISIVGTRKPTFYGQRVTRDLTREFVNLGWLVISGFMYGIDTLSHQVALENGGQTLGILGYGFGNFSPRTHGKLFDRYLKQGMTFITEYPPWQKASKSTFPRRNRIVAGLSLATLVTEGAAKSGTLITAHQAAEYGRVVGAVPGPITSPYSEGTRSLINEGAKLVATARDILQEFESDWNNYDVGNKVLEDERSLSSNCTEKQLLTLLQHNDGLTTDQLCQLTKWEVPHLLSTLNSLTLQNLVIQQGEKWFFQGGL